MSESWTGQGGVTFLPIVHVCGHRDIGLVYITDQSSPWDVERLILEKCLICGGRELLPESWIEELRRTADFEYRTERVPDWVSEFYFIPEYGEHSRAELKQMAFCEAFGIAWDGEPGVWQDDELANAQALLES